MKADFSVLGLHHYEPKAHGLIDTCEGLLLVVASGRCVWDDLDAWGYQSKRYVDVMAVNDMIMHFPGRLAHVYSNDHRLLPWWIQARRPNYVREYDKENKRFLVHTCVIGGSMMAVWPFPGHGTSSLNAVYTGLALGYDEIVVCGAPLDNTGHYFDPPWVGSTFTNQVPDKEGEPNFWRGAKSRIFKGKVKSMSGRSRELLGAP